MAAKKGYDSVATANRTQDYPPLLVIITGKGPLKEYYLREIEDRNWQFVDVCTPWLDPDDYPLVVGETCSPIPTTTTTLSKIQFPKLSI